MSTKNPMNIERFGRLTEAYGADIGRWPEAEREAATELLAASEAARAMHRDAERLDSLLDSLPEHRPSPDLLKNILAKTALPCRRPLGQRLVDAWRGFWTELGHPVPVGLVLAASLALGIVLGAETITPAPQAGVDLVQFALASDVYTQE